MLRRTGRLRERLLVGTVVAACLLAAPAFASVTWERVPAAPTGSYLSLATDGTDLAAVVSTPVYASPDEYSAVLRTSAGWKALNLPAGLRPRMVALSSDRLLVVAQGDCIAVSPTPVWLLDRTSGIWSRLPELVTESCELAVGLEFEDGKPLVLTSRCRVFSLSGATWETPGGWPAPSNQAQCSQTFVRDSGRLFAVAGAIFEYVGGHFEYPPQPEGPERVGVAVMPEGLAILQNGSTGDAELLYLPGRPTPLLMPYFSFGPLIRHGGAFFVRTFAGPARLFEGRWALTRLTVPDLNSREVQDAWGPEGPFVEAGGELFAGSSKGLFVGTSSVRRLLPVAVKSSGVSGASFTSHLQLANFGDTDATAVLELRDPSGLAAGTTRVNIPLPARRTVRIDDLIAQFRGVNPEAPSTGSVSIAFEGGNRDEEFWAGSDVVSSLGALVTRTFVPAVPWGSGPGYYIESAVGFVPRVADGVRTNVGWADAGDAGPPGALDTPFSLAWTGDSSSFSIFAPAGAWNQVPLASALPATSSGGVLELSGPVYYGGPDCCWGYESIAPRDLVPYAVEVDQHSGDGSFAVFETLSLDTDRSNLFFPAVVRTAGAGGVLWSSEVRLGRGNDIQGAATAEVTFRGVIGDTWRTVVWAQPLASGDGVRFDSARAAILYAGLPDVGQPVVGTLSVKPDLTQYRSVFGEVRVTSSVGASGAMGATVRGIPVGRWASSRAIVGGLSDDEALRSNLALANPEPEGGPNVTLNVSLVRGTDGQVIGSAGMTLAPGERWQVEVRDLVSDGTAPGESYAVIRNAGAVGRFVAYGVVHERSSGDGAERPMTGVE
jgi:hypothetical protein